MTLPHRIYIQPAYEKDGRLKVRGSAKAADGGLVPIRAASVGAIDTGCTSRPCCQGVYQYLQSGTAYRVR